MQSVVYCPKCSGDMVPMRRGNVLIDTCADCGGLYLDRGELEKIIAAGQDSTTDWDEVDEDDEFEYDSRQSGRRRKSRKRRFLADLFDLD